MGKVKFRAVMATTHLDKHNERFSIEELEEMCNLDKEQGGYWLHWDHQTTLPPVGHCIANRIEKGDDKEYSLIGDGMLYDETDYESFSLINVQLDSTRRVYSPGAQPLNLDQIQIGYDKANFDPGEVQIIIQALEKYLPTDEEQVVRKAEIPAPVIWVLLAISTGILSRVGERIADKVVEVASPKFNEVGNKIKQLFALKHKPNDEAVDIILGVPHPDSDAVIEAAIENANEVSFNKAWESVENLYALIDRIVESNPRDQFVEIKFLFNPSSLSWEINYLITRTHRIFLGPRYTDPSHPLCTRWQKMRDRLNDKENLFVSVSYTKHMND